MIMDSRGDQRVAYLYRQYSFRWASKEEVDEFLNWVMGLKGEQLVRWYIQRFWEECPLIVYRRDLEFPDWDEMMRKIVGAPLIPFDSIEKPKPFRFF